MKVESTGAQINVRDNDSFAGVNINPALSGYAADMMFWGGAAYLCRRKDDSFLRVLVVPGEKWLQDIKDGGYEIVGALSDCAKLEDENARFRLALQQISGFATAPSLTRTPEATMAHNALTDPNFGTDPADEATA
jgi:hypothetical protein